jgi:L,D-transpeptidase YbiS
MFAGRGTGYAYGPASLRSGPEAASLPTDPGASRKLQTKLQTQNKQYEAALQKLAPSGTYVVVDQTQNRLYVMNDDKIVRTAVCSAGSGMVLTASSGSKKWVFDTPRGVFKVRNKIANPIWKKPDWAFAEEGKTLPTNPEDRFESGTLGKYALYLEDGYMIHGTLYTRLLGRSVTHGCIRLGPEDLQAVWDAVPIGTPVYIF